MRNSNYFGANAKNIRSSIASMLDTMDAFLFSASQHDADAFIDTIYDVIGVVLDNAVKDGIIKIAEYRSICDEYSICTDLLDSLNEVERSIYKTLGV